MERINSDIKTGDFKQVYLLYGTETYLKIQYKQRLLKALQPDEDTMNFSHYHGKGINVKEVIDMCETMPFFADKRVILLEDTGFFKNKCDELADYIKELPEYMCLIFVEAEADKRSKMYKAVKESGIISEFTEQNEKTLMMWVLKLLNNEGKKIKQKDMELFLAKTGTDMGNIRMELDKLISFTEGRDVVTAQDIETICSTQISNRIFEMLRAVTERNQQKALDLYYDLITLKEPPMKIMALLGRQFRQLMLTKKMINEGVTQTEIAQRIGVASFAVKNLVNISRYYTIKELEEAVKDCVWSEEAVKTGHLQDVLSVELMIIKYSSKKQ